MKGTLIGKKYSSIHKYPTDKQIYTLLYLLRKQDLAFCIPNDLKITEEALKKDNYIVIDTINKHYLGDLYIIQEKGLIWMKKYEDELYWNKVKKWYKEPDNQWKIFTFLASPLFGFAFGVATSHFWIRILHHIIG